MSGGGPWGESPDGPRPPAPPGYLASTPIGNRHVRLASVPVFVSYAGSVAYEVQAALIGSASALLGGIVGTIGTLAAGRRQHERTIDEALKAEARARAREAALALEHLIDELARDIPDQHHAPSKGDETLWVARSNRIFANSERAALLLLDIPEPLRGRLSEGHRFLSWADDICVREQGFHYQSCGSICYEVAMNMRRTLSHFLRHERDLPPVTKRWLEYAEACKEAEDEKRFEFAEEIAQDEAARIKWLEDRPLLKERLSQSSLPERFPDS